MSKETKQVLSRRTLLAAVVGGAFASIATAARSSTTQQLGDILGALSYHVTEPGTTLLDLARYYDLGILEISAVNRGVDVWVPGDNRLIVLPTAMVLPEVERKGIVVNLAELRLYHFTDDGTVHTHAIGCRA